MSDSTAPPGGDDGSTGGGGGPERPRVVYEYSHGQGAAAPVAQRAEVAEQPPSTLRRVATWIPALLLLLLPAAATYFRQVDDHSKAYAVGAGLGTATLIVLISHWLSSLA